MPIWRLTRPDPKAGASADERLLRSDGLARRTYIGTDGTEPQRSGVLGYFIEGLEGLLGFFGLVILPAMAAATLYHWIFD